jgi:hypothetical protein
MRAVTSSGNGPHRVCAAWALSRDARNRPGGRCWRIDRWRRARMELTAARAGDLAAASLAAGSLAAVRADRAVRPAPADVPADARAVPAPAGRAQAAAGTAAAVVMALAARAGVHRPAVSPEPGVPELVAHPVPGAGRQAAPAGPAALAAGPVAQLAGQAAAGRHLALAVRRKLAARLSVPPARRVRAGPVAAKALARLAMTGAPGLPARAVTARLTATTGPANVTVLDSAIEAPTARTAVTAVAGLRTGIARAAVPTVIAVAGPHTPAPKAAVRTVSAVAGRRTPAARAAGRTESAVAGRRTPAVRAAGRTAIVAAGLPTRKGRTAAPTETTGAGRPEPSVRPARRPAPSVRPGAAVRAAPRPGRAAAGPAVQPGPGVPTVRTPHRAGAVMTRVRAAALTGRHAADRLPPAVPLRGATQRAASRPASPEWHPAGPDRARSGRTATAARLAAIRGAAELAAPAHPGAVLRGRALAVRGQVQTGRRRGQGATAEPRGQAARVAGGMTHARQTDPPVVPRAGATRLERAAGPSRAPSTGVVPTAATAVRTAGRTDGRVPARPGGMTVVRRGPGPIAAQGLAGGRTTGIAAPTSGEADRTPLAATPRPGWISRTR